MMPLKRSFVILALLVACNKNTVSKLTPKKFCMEEDCIALDEASYNCVEAKSEIECKRFVSLFDKLTSPYNCDGKIDHSLNINACSKRKGATYTDVHMDRLSELNTKEAMELYASEKFRKVLDGNIAETHSYKSKKLEMILKPSLLPQGYKVECIEQERSVSKSLVSKTFNGSKAINYTEYKIDPYVVYVGDNSIKIQNAEKKCQREIAFAFPESKLFKFKHHKVISLLTYGKELEYETLIDLDNCSILWKSENEYESLEMTANPIAVHVKINNVKNSSFKPCSECWDINHRECQKI